MKIRDAFQAEPGYVFLEADYSQMEVVCLAAASCDPVLIQEVRDGIDLHMRNAAAWRKVPEDQVSNKDRKTAKIMTFQLAYGAQAKRISTDFGLPLKETQAFIDAFCEKYKGVNAWWSSMIEKVNQSLKTIPVYLKQEPEHRSTLVTDYGKRYTFVATDTKREGYGKNAKQTPVVGERFIKNYPIQGLAADLLKMAQASLWRDRENLLRLGAVPLIQIHDALYFKFEKQERYDLDKFIQFLEYHMTAAPVDKINQLAGEEWWPRDLPLRIDIKIGEKWSQMEKYVRN